MSPFQSPRISNYTPSSGKMELKKPIFYPYFSLGCGFLCSYLILSFNEKELKTYEDFIIPFIGLILFGTSFYYWARNNSLQNRESASNFSFRHIMGALFTGLFVISMIQNIKDLSVLVVTQYWIRNWLLSYVLISLSVYSLFYKPSYLSAKRTFIKIICYSLIFFILLTLPECNEYVFSSFSNYGYFKFNWGIILLQATGLLVSLVMLNFVNRRKKNE